MSLSLSKLIHIHSLTIFFVPFYIPSYYATNVNPKLLFQAEKFNDIVVLRLKQKFELPAKTLNISTM